MTTRQATASAEPALSMLMGFLDPWDGLNTSEFSLEKNMTLTDSFGLELIREVDALRRSTCMKQSPIMEFPSAEHLERFEKYITFVRQLIHQEVEQNTAFKFSWTSPLAGKHTHFWKLSGLSQELAMATFQLASAMRAAAYLLTAAAAAASTGGSSELPAAAVAAAAESSSNPTGAAAGPLADAATLLRRAAGMHQWLAEQHLLRLPDLPTDRPAEMLPSMSNCMRLVCLAEAQAITAHRAGQRGSRPATTSALHLGAADLFEQAAKVLREKSGDFQSLSDKLRRFLAISSSLQRSRAQRWWGQELLAQGEAGQGEGCCLEAASALKDCLIVAEGEASWKQLLVAELEEVEETRRRIEKERSGVYYQKVCRPAQSVPTAAKILVTAIEYVPVEADTLLKLTGVSCVEFALQQ